MKSDLTPQEIGKPQRRILASGLSRFSHLCGVSKSWDLSERLTCVLRPDHGCSITHTGNGVADHQFNWYAWSCIVQVTDVQTEVPVTQSRDATNSKLPMNVFSNYYSSCEMRLRLVVNVLLWATLAFATESCVGNKNPEPGLMPSRPLGNLLRGEVVKMRFVDEGENKIIHRGQSRNGSKINLVLEAEIEPVKSSFNYGSSWGYSTTQRVLSLVEFSMNGVSHSVPADQVRLFKNPLIRLSPTKVYLYPGGEYALVAFAGGDGERSYTAGFIFGPSGYVTTIPNRAESDRLETLYMLSQCK